jgi:CheY-like chemotaxis protein
MSVSILVVDDEPDVAEMFRQRFRREARKVTYVMHSHPWTRPSMVIRDPARGAPCRHIPAVVAQLVECLS